MAALKLLLVLVVAAVFAIGAFVFYELGSVGPAYTGATGWIALGLAVMSALTVLVGLSRVIRARAARDIQ